MKNGVEIYKPRVMMARVRYTFQQRWRRPKIGGGGSSNVVGIMCPLQEIGLRELPKTGRASMPINLVDNTETEILKDIV